MIATTTPTIAIPIDAYSNPVSELICAFALAKLLFAVVRSVWSFPISALTSPILVSSSDRKQMTAGITTNDFVLITGTTASRPTVIVRRL